MSKNVDLDGRKLYGQRNPKSAGYASRCAPAPDAGATLARILDGVL